MPKSCTHTLEKWWNDRSFSNRSSSKIFVRGASSHPRKPKHDAMNRRRRCCKSWSDTTQKCIREYLHLGILARLNSTNQKWFKIIVQICPNASTHVWSSASLSRGPEIAQILLATLAVSRGCDDVGQSWSDDYTRNYFLDGCFPHGRWSMPSFVKYWSDGLQTDRIQSWSDGLETDRMEPYIYIYILIVSDRIC